MRRLGALGLALAATLAVLAAPVAAGTPQHRLPAGTRWGRCLLVVDGQTRISGKCSYRIYKGGAFHIDGPHQVFDGIDYPKARGMADRMSTDYWADVFPEDGHWTGYGNSGIRDVHAGEGEWGTLRRDGACFVGKAVRVCLWRS
ncbi:hypothetical protein [Sphingomonas sp. KR3-1]|uniref:hypothetical protein n=1 Tax=Sphingomonas sp. KR3-1 TaxID=3156611 RepID=UPI0032B5BC81